MRAEEMADQIALGQGMTRAFARRKSAAFINERRVIETMASMANAEGGTLFIGVDSDGSISGCYPFHGDRTDPAQLAMAVRRYTNPPLEVDVSAARIGGAEVIAVRTDAHPSPVATAWGTYRTRRLNERGVAEAVGMDPTYLFTRYRDANGVDWALSPARGAAPDDIDPEAIASFRELAASHGGDALAAQRSDEALLRALGFRTDAEHPLTLGAIALFGRTEAIRTHLPYHQLVFSDRRVSHRTSRSVAPLATMLSALTEHRAALGPAFPLVINALVHRDYSLPAPVYVALEEDFTSISSPGGLPRGVDAAALAEGRPVYAPRSLHLSTAISLTGLTRGAGTGYPEVARTLSAADLDPVSFAGTHGQGVTVTVTQHSSAPLAVKGNDAMALGAVQRAGRAGLASGDVAAITGLSQQQAYRALRKLVDASLIRKIGSTRTTRYYAK
ncbi:RNA-binding domain-containing protein [Corynebacterium hadale]